MTLSEPMAVRSARRLPRLSAEAQLVVLLIAVWLMRGVLYAAVNPHLESPDESAHLEYVQSLWRSGGEDVTGAQNEQPPLYYWLTLPAFSLVAGQSPALELLAVRLTSVLMTAGTVLFAYFTARTLVPNQPFVYLGTAAFVALVPEFGYVGASANNDNLANLVSAAMIYLLVAGLTHGFRWYCSAGLLILIGIGVGAKTTTWPVSVVVLLTMAVRAALRAFPRRRVEVVAAAAALLVLGGVAFATSSRGQSLLEVQKGSEGGVLSMDRFRTFLSSIDPWLPAYQFKTFWMTFRNDSIMLPDPLFWLLLAVVVLAVAGLVGRMARSIRSVARAEGNWAAARGEDVGFRWPILVLLIAVQWSVLVVRFYLDKPLTLAERAANAGWDPTISLLLGRFLFPVIIPIGFLLVWGLAAFVPARWRGPALAALIALLVVVDWIALGVLFSRYYAWEQ